MTAEAGLAALWFAAAIGLVQLAIGGMALRAGEAGDPRLLARLAAARGVLLAGSLAALGALFARTDLSAQIVAHRSHSAWPLTERLAALWSGPEAAVLLGLSAAAMAAAAAATRAWGWSAPARALALVLEALAGLPGCLWLLALARPFARLGPPAPEGQGLGLDFAGQGLAVHAPLLGLGGGMLAASAALALAGYACRIGRPAFGRAIRPWAAAAWTLFALAIVAATWRDAAAAKLAAMAGLLAASLAMTALAGWRGASRTSPARHGAALAAAGMALLAIGLASGAAFRRTAQLTLREGQVAEFAGWRIALRAVRPVALANATALEAELEVRHGGGAPQALAPQARDYFAPARTAEVAGRAGRWNGVLQVRLLGEAAPGQWALQLAWRPFAQLKWLGGLLAALGGTLAVWGHIAANRRRAAAREMLAYRRRRQGR